MLTAAQFQHWDTTLQLPVMRESCLSAGVKDAVEGSRPVLFNTEQQEDYPVHSLMAGYKKRWANTAELGCLYLLALFPYPVAKDVLLSTLSTLKVPTDRVIPKRKKSFPAAKGMLFNTLSTWQASTDKIMSGHDEEPSVGLQQTLGYLLQDGRPNAAKLADVLDKLDIAGLLNIDGDTVSTFRPVSNYFADSLKTHFFDDWRLLQQQLVYYYDDLAASSGDDEPRFWFNCKQLLHSLATTHKQQAMDEIYRPHIAPFLSQPRSVGRSGCQLRLHLLAGFFQQPWHKIDFCLNSETKSYLQAEAGKALYQLGEQEIALELLNNASSMLIKEENWEDAGDVMHLLGRHAEQQQDLLRSIRLFRQSITYAEQGEGKNPQVLLRRLRNLFELYKNNGDIEEAGLIADKAKLLLAQTQRKKSDTSVEVVAA